MGNKLEIPTFKYIAQDPDGFVIAFLGKPEPDESWWHSISDVAVCEGRENPNWEDTLIDLETDDYEFEDGILRRIEK